MQNEVDSLLTTDLSNVSTLSTHPNFVPNQFPTTTSYPYRIAIIGEAPGAEEVEARLPFVGASGRHLWHKAAKHGIVREACYVGNVVQHKPPGNDITKFDRDGPEFTTGKAKLKEDLAAYRPNLVLCLGATPLHWASCEHRSVMNYRGSLFQSPHGFKAMATLHPAYVLRDYGANSLFDFDLKRARQEGTTPELSIPQRELVTTVGPMETLALLDGLYCGYRGKPVACDIEGYVDAMSCISFAPSPQFAFIVPTTQEYWGELYPLMWTKLATYLSSPHHPKILQNCLYDAFILQYSYAIPVRGIVDDTMLKHWELFCELDKNLGLQTSIYTKEPYYKQERKSDDRDTFWKYCCKDSAVTHEISSALELQLKKDKQGSDHYRFNMELLEPLLYMQLKGINYDKIKADAKARDITSKIHRLQWALNQITGRGNYTEVRWFQLVADCLCFKKSRHLVSDIGSIVNHTKTSCFHEGIRCTEILSTSEWYSNPALLGELAVIVASKTEDPDLKREISLNVDSSDQISDFLYRESGLEIQYKKEKGKKTDVETSDVNALLTLYKKTNDATLKLILVIRGLLTRLTALETSLDRDSRIRCGYNLVGTETGRLSCSESATGSGFNLQTATKKDRDVFLPDSGYWLFQCDLAGADGWTVAAHCRACGDPTMWDDYKFGLKPAKIIAAMHTFGAQINQWPREKIKEWCDKVDQDGWLYFACKRVQHGTNYGLGNETMSDQIKKDSYKFLGEPIIVPPLVCGTLKTLYLQRYPGVLAWHQRLKTQLATKGYLRSANGHLRIFFGRKQGEGSHDTFRQMASDEPQNNTCYATNLALHKLWTDPENRLVTKTGECNRKTLDDGNRCELRIQPLHQVHDALIGQFRKEETEWAKGKIRGWFDNSIVIAGQPIVIPFEGAYGPSWGEQGPKYGGGLI